MTTTSLPSWLPLLNLAVSLIGMALAVGLLIRSRPPDHLTAAALVFATMVLVGGALNQAGILGLDGWVLIGTGGRLLVVTFLSVVAVTQWRLR